MRIRAAARQYAFDGAGRRAESLGKDPRRILHPRCANCHTPDDRPRWGDLAAGTARVHPMGVARGGDGSGWHLAPAEMIWFGKPAAEICAQIKDPLRNGNRTLQDVADHVRKDALVAWGWNPAPGREPAPGSIDETYTNLIAWTNAGARCPEN